MAALRFFTSSAPSAWQPGLKRDLLAAAAVFINIPGVDALSRYTGTEDLVFKIRKNLFETLTFVARKPSSPKPSSPR